MEATHALRRTDTLNSARMRLLEQVDRRGPLAVADLHQGWPVTRHQTRILVLDLSRDGLLAFVRGSSYGVPLAVITDAGRALLAGAATSEP